MLNFAKTKITKQKCKKNLINIGDVMVDIIIISKS